MNEGRILWQGTVSKLLSEANGKVYTINADKKFLTQLKKDYIVKLLLSFFGRLPNLPGSATFPRVFDTLLFPSLKEYQDNEDSPPLSLSDT